MEKSKYNNMYNVFKKWVDVNILVKSYSFSEIKDLFLKSEEIKVLDEYNEFIEEKDIDFIIVDWMSRLVKGKTLIKEDNSNGSKYHYNYDKINEFQKNIIKQSSKKRKLIYIGISMLIIIIIGIIVTTQVMKENERKNKEQQKFAEEKRVAEELIKDLAEEYNINDIEFDHIENTSLDSVVYYKSEKFEKISNEDKILFITSVEKENHLKKIFNGLYFDLAIISNGNTYVDFTTDGKSWLRMNGKMIFSMETSYARSVEESLQNSLSSDSDKDSNTKKYYSIQRNYSGCYPSKPHYVCYEEGRCRCVSNP